MASQSLCRRLPGLNGSFRDEFSSHCRRSGSALISCAAYAFQTPLIPRCSHRVAAREGEKGWDEGERDFKFCFGGGRLDRAALWAE